MQKYKDVSKPSSPFFTLYRYSTRFEHLARLAFTGLTVFLVFADSTYFTSRTNNLSQDKVRFILIVLLLTVVIFQTLSAVMRHEERSTTSNTNATESYDKHSSSHVSVNISDNKKPDRIQPIVIASNICEALFIGSATVGLILSLVSPHLTINLKNQNTPIGDAVLLLTLSIVMTCIFCPLFTFMSGNLRILKHHKIPKSHKATEPMQSPLNAPDIINSNYVSRIFRSGIGVSQNEERIEQKI